MGIKDKEFFVEQYIEDENDFGDVCFKYREQIKKEIKSNKGEYENKSSKYISQIVNETNKNSLPRYEFSLLYYNIFEQVAGYTSQQYRDDFDEYQENTEILTGFIVYFLAFKDKGELENYFNENEKMMNFNYDSFKTIMEEVDSVLKKTRIYNT